MAVAPKFVDINHDDESINRVQDHLAKTLDPLVASPLNGAVLVKNIALKTGVTLVPHNLGRRPQGFAVVRIHATLAPIDWTPFVYANNWSAALFGGIWPTPGWRLDPTGRVFLRGLIANSGLPVTSSVVTSLPSGLYPSGSAAGNAQRLFLVPVESGGNHWISRFDVQGSPSPQLVYQGALTYAGTPAGAIGDLSLDGISWDIPTPVTPVLADNLDAQTEDGTKVIRITSSGPCTADLLFF
jgi:hypothetical protein